eukprot:CAMPEP_0170455894 /NCGR_PEP_ID=MMETSP0123-20130129/3705_1 /TAXON_ID=182087 /ORGANISM="Favella ehrenbergii, Strain Fehren 1" /LENGTH=77 /DNA_ID=CAMNT_0010719181 /DNA_START=189 /DNA_END=420 /DNA_ORIENTATION=+
MTDEAEEIQITIHLKGHEGQEAELAELEKLRIAFEKFNMANPCEVDDSEGDDEMITAETLKAFENTQNQPDSDAAWT